MKIKFSTLLLTLTIQTALAQDEDSTKPVTSLPLVFVMADKSPKDVQSIPYSISALNARDAKNFRLWNLNQLTSIVPNLYSADPGDGRNVTSVRGIVSSSYDPAVVTYIDGVSQFTLDTYIPQVMNVSSIEILRGPQGTLYGRNAMGGVVNVITAQPNNKASLSTEISFSDLRNRALLNFKTPIVQDKLYFGVSFLYEGTDGYYFNEYDSSDFDKQHQFGGNYFLKYILNGRWNLTANVKHLANRNHGAFPLQDISEITSRPFVVNQNAKSKLIDNIFDASLTLNYAGNKFDFNSQLAYQSNYRYYKTPIDGDFSPLDIITIINNYGNHWNNVKVWTEEFRFTSPTNNNNSKIQWIAGGYIFLQDVPNKQAVHFGEDAQLVGSPDKNYSIINTTNAKNAGFAGFGKVTFPITPGTHLSIGLRYDHQHSKQSVLGEYQPDASPVPIFNTQADTSAAASFHAVSPTLSVLHNISDHVRIYGVYSRGYRTGGFTQLGLDPSQPPLYSYKPEYSNNFEVGTKMNLIDNKLRLNISAFYTTITDAQVPSLILPDAITVTRNAGKLTSKGFELEASAVPARGLEMAFNFGFTDAKFRQLKLASNGSEVDLKGNRQIFTPNYTSMFAIQKAFTLSEKKTISLITRGEWMLIGKQYFNLANTMRQSPYDLLNLRVGLSMKHIDVFVWGRNLVDSKYITYGYEFGAVHLGEPRNFGVTLAARI